VLFWGGFGKYPGFRLRISCLNYSRFLSAPLKFWNSNVTVTRRAISSVFWAHSQIFFSPTSVKRLSPIFYLEAQYNCDNFYRLSLLLTMSMAFVRLKFLNMDKVHFLGVVAQSARRGVP